MNRDLFRQIPSLPIPMVRMFANMLGKETEDVNALFELEGMFIEEVVDKDVNATNVFKAFHEVEDSLRGRWLKYVGSVSDAHDV